MNFPWQRELAVAQAALEGEVRNGISLRSENDTLRRELELERVKRISAEAIASERHAEIERLLAANKALDERNTQIFSERLKSLDIVNGRLMEPRTEAPPQDIKQFTDSAVKKLGVQAVTTVRNLHREMDMALLKKQFPQLFPSKVAATQPDGVVTPGSAA